jgi:hypothetical protein
MNPLNGIYGIQLLGTVGGSYTLVAELSTSAGVNSKNYVGQILSGEIQAHIANVSGNALALHQVDTFPWTYLYLELFIVVVFGLLFLRWIMRPRFSYIEDEDQTVVY